MTPGTAASPAASHQIPFTPAVPGDEKAEEGIAYLQPGGLVVHTGWSYPPRGERVLRQHPAYEGGTVQPWLISTPGGHRAARFSYCTQQDAEVAAARITAALPEGTWPVGGDTDTEALLPLALEASHGPEMLPLTHNGKPSWGCSGYGDVADFWMPDTRPAYERMIAAHGPIPKNCPTCTRLARAQKKAGYLPHTSHWPRWSVTGHRGNSVRPHCYCMECMRLTVRIGTLGTVADDNGHTVPGSKATGLFSPLPIDVARDVGRDIDREDRPFAWFSHFLTEGGCVVIDERDGVGLWPTGVNHDDALFSETGITADEEGL
ncbi:hypothetical protein [Streptomyces nanshensis]|uniref:Uncharacterized protein n=1 Tax=Streptomyces nanshensis TaxID=518642 RepID=A0A1E7L552_9ACTN|nr:hypothetical protein [Streptomyces nanshensis]OEV11327.1 hypothetical protein AN218_13320 [Streptomyces nanshensis]